MLQLLRLPCFELVCPVHWRELIKVIGISSRKPLDDVGQIGLWVDALSLGTNEQCVEDSASLTGFGMSDEEVILLADGAGTNGVLDEVVVDLDFAVVQIDLHAWPLPLGIA